jgi:hypothetical protein
VSYLEHKYCVCSFIHQKYSLILLHYPSNYKVWFLSAFAKEALMQYFHCWEWTMRDIKKYKAYTQNYQMKMEFCACAFWNSIFRSHEIQARSKCSINEQLEAFRKTQWSLNVTHFVYSNNVKMICKSLFGLYRGYSQSVSQWNCMHMSLLQPELLYVQVFITLQKCDNYVGVLIKSLAFLNHLFLY